MAYPYEFKDVVKMNEEKERLEYMKDKARGAIVDAVARSYEIKTRYKSAYIVDLEVLFNCVESAEKTADITRLIPGFLLKYNEVGGDTATKKIREFFEKFRRKPIDKRKI